MHVWAVDDSYLNNSLTSFTGPLSEQQLARQYRSWSWLRSANGDVSPVRAKTRNAQRAVQGSSGVCFSACKPGPEEYALFCEAGAQIEKTSRDADPRARDRHAGGNLGVLPRTHRRSVHASRNVSKAFQRHFVIASDRGISPRAPTGTGLKVSLHSARLIRNLFEIQAIQAQWANMPGCLTVSSFHHLRAFRGRISTV